MKFPPVFVTELQLALICHICLAYLTITRPLICGQPRLLSLLTAPHPMINVQASNLSRTFLDFLRYICIRQDDKLTNEPKVVSVPEKATCQRVSLPLYQNATS
jgi:hypothetical protein